MDWKSIIDWVKVKLGKKHCSIDNPNDPKGLGSCKWTGALTLNTFGNLFGGGVVILAIESKCCNNQKAKGIYLVPVGGITFGPLPAQATAQFVELYGPRTPSKIDPQGWFAYISAGASFSGGYNYSIITSGSLFGKGHGGYLGIDAGIDGIFGYSIRITGSDKIPCSER